MRASLQLDCGHSDRRERRVITAKGSVHGRAEHDKDRAVEIGRAGVGDAEAQQARVAARDIGARQVEERAGKLPGREPGAPAT